MQGRKLFYGQTYTDFYAVKNLMNYNDGIGSITCYNTTFGERELEYFMEEELPVLQSVRSRGIMHLFWPRTELESQTDFPSFSLFFGILLEPSELNPNSNGDGTETPHDPLVWKSSLSDLFPSDLKCIFFDFDQGTMEVLDYDESSS